MVGLKHLTAIAVASLHVASGKPGNSKRDKYCPGGGEVCFSEYKVATHNIVYRIAIPETLAAPFDIYLSIVAPKAVAWAGLAWGGKMGSNPLTVAWANGNTAVVSSRWTTCVSCCAYLVES